MATLRCARPHDMKGLFLRRFDVILKFYGVDLVGADNRPLFGIERDTQIYTSPICIDSRGTRSISAQARGKFLQELGGI